MASNNTKRVNQMGAGKRKGAVTVLFKKGKGKGGVWAKTFKSGLSAKRAVIGVQKKTNSKLVSARPAKGFKFGAIVKRMNRK